MIHVDTLRIQTVEGTFIVRRSVRVLLSWTCTGDIINLIDFLSNLLIINIILWF